MDWEISAGAGKEQLGRDKYCQNLDIRLEQEIVKMKGI